MFDVPGAYLNTEIPEDKSILLKTEGEFADIMWEVNPEHKKKYTCGEWSKGTIPTSSEIPI